MTTNRDAPMSNTHNDVDHDSRPPWVAQVLTLFPEAFPGTLGLSVIGRAMRQGLWSMDCINIRDHAIGPHSTVDGRMFGGGPGMILRPDVLDGALSAALTARPNTNRRRIYLSARGRQYNQEMATQLAQEDGVILLCGRFEGVDQRFLNYHEFEEISVGDYVLAGGEVAAMLFMESIIRLLPSVIGEPKSLDEESHSNGLLEYPHFGKPRSYREIEVPEVLVSGNHAAISEWRQQQSQLRTKSYRPDLWENYQKSLIDQNSK